LTHLLRTHAQASPDASFVEVVEGPNATYADVCDGMLRWARALRFADLAEAMQAHLDGREPRYRGR
jgi:hypothetical protein